ncbi:Basic 7S globulin [Heracleum sosnowskyi]|uniref:Basic 7S globulin n=1 Tax=Heracleum sosnowskyi TaxID=360622 RepID=A0AAD8HRC2_9APIA|nr:Basic 7S globulin [Heracleum sosnowskyi]
MSSFIHHYSLIFVFLVAIFSVSTAAKSKSEPEPKAFIFPLRKDLKTLQYYTSIGISKRENNVPLVLNLAGQNTWFSCDAYKLPTYKPIMCGTDKCKKYNIKNAGCMICFGTVPRTPGCTLGACALSSVNDYASLSGGQSLGEDFIFVVDTNGKSVGSTHKSPKPVFPFTCSDEDMLGGLSNKTKGMAGLGNGITSLHAQLSTQFKISHKFAICLPSTSESEPGHMFIGGGPYYFLPYGKDIAKELITTPLVENPLKVRGFEIAHDPEFSYFVNVTSISVDHKLVSFNASLLSFEKDGSQGTSLSSTTTYTILRPSIYEALVSAFTKAAVFRKMKRVESIAPFGACYESKSIARSQTGPVVPYVDIGLAGNTHWRFYGANSMVSVNNDVLCLAFVGAPFTSSSIVIGTHQMENYLLEFDLNSSKLGISTSLSFRNTTCSQSRIS